MRGTDDGVRYGKPGSGEDSGHTLRSRYEIQVSGGTEVKVALMHAGMPKTVSCAYEMDGDHAVIAVPKEGNVTVEF